MGMSEREHHIKVLEQFLQDYQEWGEDLELEKTIKYAISSLKTDLKYDLMYEGEDVYTMEEIANMFNDWYYTKDEVITVLKELKQEIEELNMHGSIQLQSYRQKTGRYRQGFERAQNLSTKIIQEKITSLKEATP